MAALLLAEKVHEQGRVLVLGAGAGLELKVCCLVRPDGRFVGVDPSADMLALARQPLGELSAQVELRESYSDATPVELKGSE
ncbi:hypothetical protein FBY03_102282 [Pseudomonas sp. SJZ079]|uniref:class I SAM-dependent methyltransferase n=1 Tax=Pseudomonas sp. SJZ079 TaxID=2572887 RepID=UPI00119B78BD|nr:hypothetical protein [Pseudomonas sp. SJZ079]TWC41533.1 hypothetical protein FBY03_102282 [Pseudomonas sp. SJZ079]